MAEADDNLFAAMLDIAMGGVTYKSDKLRLDLGYQGPDAYLRDENGDPVVETIGKMDPKMLLRVLEWKRPDTWGKHPKIDVPHQCGVLVVGDTTKKLKLFGGKHRSSEAEVAVEDASERKNLACSGILRRPSPRRRKPVAATPTPELRPRGQRRRRSSKKKSPAPPRRSAATRQWIKSTTAPAGNARERTRRGPIISRPLQAPGRQSLTP